MLGWYLLIVIFTMSFVMNVCSWRIHCARLLKTVFVLETVFVVDQHSAGTYVVHDEGTSIELQNLSNNVSSDKLLVCRS